MRTLFKLWNSFTPAEQIGTVLGILGIILSVIKLEDVILFLKQATVMQYLVSILLISMIALLLLITAHVKQRRRFSALTQLQDDTNKANATLNETIKQLQVTLDELKSGRQGGPPPKYNRFEDIKNITYGRIEYPPLLYYSHQSLVKGIGIALLEKIFGSDKINTKPTLWSDWNKIKRDLYPQDGNETIDIIATPLFETRDRSRSVLFCSPIFFSDVGIYIKKNSFLHVHLMGKLEQAKLSDPQRYALLPSGTLTFDDAIVGIQELAAKLDVMYIEGEISEKMINKHLKAVDKLKIKSYKRVEMKIPELVNTVAELQSDVVFTEIYQAEKSPVVQQDKVINVLAPQELLYPVSFAVRKEEHVLRNYINIKLLEIDREVPNGILNIIIDVLIEHNDVIGEKLKQLEGNKAEQVKLVQKYFIHKRAVSTVSGEPSAAIVT